MLIGVMLGIIAGMLGRAGSTPRSVGSSTSTLCFPQTIMLLALSTVALTFLTETLHVPSGNAAQAVFVIAILAIFGWMAPARLIRGQVLSLREREFVEAAQLFGPSRWRLWTQGDPAQPVGARSWSTSR